MSPLVSQPRMSQFVNRKVTFDISPFISERFQFTFKLRIEYIRDHLMDFVDRLYEDNQANVTDDYSSSCLRQLRGIEHDLRARDRRRRYIGRFRYIDCQKRCYINRTLCDLIKLIEIQEFINNRDETTDGLAMRNTILPKLVFDGALYIMETCLSLHLEGKLGAAIVVELFEKNLRRLMKLLEPFVTGQHKPLSPPKDIPDEVKLYEICCVLLGEAPQVNYSCPIGA